MKSFADQVGSLKKRQHAGEVGGFAAVTIAALAFIGSLVGLPLLSNWGSDFATMRPLGALCLAALGIAVVYPGKDSRIAFTVGVAIAALAALGLGLVALVILFNIQLGIIDRWLARWAIAPGLGAAAFQIASAATVAFGAAGGSLAFSRFERHRFAATMLAGAVGIIVVFALLGYLTGVDTLYGSVSVNSPPLPTAVGLLFVASGTMFRIGTIPVFQKRRPLWQLLVMLGSAVVAPLLLFGAYAGFRIAEAQLRQVREDLTIEARALSANVDREIIGEIERLQALAASPSLRRRDFAEFQRQAEASLALRQSGNIMLVDREMQQLVNTWVPFGKPLPKVPVPGPTGTALATGKPQVTGLFMDPAVEQFVFAIIVPVQLDGENRYALVRSPSQHDLAGLVAANELPAGFRPSSAADAHSAWGADRPMTRAGVATRRAGAWRDGTP